MIHFLTMVRFLALSFFSFAMMAVPLSLHAASRDEALSAGIIPIIEQWMDVERAFYSMDAALPDNLAAFRVKLDDYINSPLFLQYEGSTLIAGDQKENIDRFVMTFARASAAGNRDEADAAAQNIRAGLISWQYFESATSHTIFSRTYFFFTVFMLIIMVLVLILWRLHRDLLLSRMRGADAAAFSQAVMHAHEMERSRISVELHDTILQDLGRLKHLTEEQGGDGSLLKIETELMTRLRSVCQTIMPPDFSRLPLLDSLYTLSIDFHERTGIPCRVGMGEGLATEGLSEELQLHCYRTVQEAFTNIEKHAHAANAFLTVQNGRMGERASLVICISDDGIGMNTGEAARPSRNTVLGIRGMYERIAILKGSLSFNSEMGHGLTVRIEIPVEPANSTGGGGGV